jgi:gamma-glutamylcyclotransferase (GGCT)/AIG2-like uncharacterized protein YtfP
MAASSRSRFLDRSAWLPGAATMAPEAAPPGFEYSLLHRTVFVYGPLMAEETMKAMLQTNRILQQRPGRVAGYGRFALKDEPLPAAIKAGPLVRCDGLLLERLQPVEMRAIDALMNKAFDRVVVSVEAENGFGGQEQVEALMYVCPSEALVNTDQPWSYTDFRKEHLERFVEKVVRPTREQFEHDEKALPPMPEEPEEK